MNRMKAIAALAVLFAFAPVTHARSGDIAIDIKGTTFTLPLQNVNATQLYAFSEGKGYPALESVLISHGKIRLSAGAAAELGTGINVPFVSISTRLSERFFNVGDNDLYFGVWGGKPSHGGRAIFGIQASQKLW